MAEATLDAYTFLLKHELDINMKGIPPQWLPTQKGTPQLPMQTPAMKSTVRNDNTPKQTNANPANPRNGPGTNSNTTTTYTNQPHLLAANKTLHELRQKYGKVLHELLKEAGISSKSGLNMNSLPNSMCL